MLKLNSKSNQHNCSKSHILAMVSLTMLSACQATYQMAGETSNGKTASGVVTADLSDTNRVEFTVDGSKKCSGTYTVGMRSPFPIVCNDGVKGTASVTPDSDKLGGDIDFKLADGTSGKISTNREKKATVKSNETKSNPEQVQQVQEAPSPRKTTIFVGLLPQYATSFEGDGFSVDVFRYFCQVTIAYKNRSSSIKAPQFKILFTNGNTTVGESFAMMPATLPGGESKSFGSDACQGNPNYIMSGGT